MAKIAFLGLGVMGYPMAGHIKTKGQHEVVVYNRTYAKAQKWTKAYGGRAFETPYEAAKGCDFVFSCVGNDEDLRAITLGEAGAFSVMKAGSVFIDNTTVSATISQELHHSAQAAGFGFLDAPISGGQAGAENGLLTVMVGGDQSDYDKAEPVIMHYARACRLMGASGSGQLTKMVNQICIAGLLQGLSEGVHFAKSAGLDTEAVFDVISKGAAGSWQMENRHVTMAQNQFDFGFAVDWMRKDLKICLEEANNIGAMLPITAIVDQFYAKVQKKNGGRWDTSSLVTLLELATKSH